MFLLVSVILSTGGGLPQCMLGFCHQPPKGEAPLGQGDPPGGDPPRRRHPPSKETPHPWKETPGMRHPAKETPLPRRPPKKEAPPRRRHPPAKETPPEGDPPRRSTPLPRRPHSPPPGPHPRGEMRGIRSRPTPKGEIEADKIQAPPPPPTGIWSMSGRYASY